MRVIEAEFLRSATDPSVGTGWPDEGPPEVAFAGRSNVGKSSLLQALMGRKGMVRISSTPGRTRLINFFRLAVGERDRPRELRFVDLPGFGYAKVSKAEREAWFPFVEKYLGHRPSLHACVLLLDARRGPELDETELDKWLRERGVVVIPVATKIDKLSKHERRPAVEKIARQLGVSTRTVLMVSSTEGEGTEELWRAVLAAIGPRTPKLG